MKKISHTVTFLLEVPDEMDKDDVSLLIPNREHIEILSLNTYTKIDGKVLTYQSDEIQSEENDD